MDRNDLDRWHMRHALDLAVRGEGRVEPNPMVGCVVARGAEVIGQGYHRRYGGDHAEVEALRVAGSRAAGAEVYVTLEPCCHQGKTPPCTEALLRARPARVVVAQPDPFPEVAGRGLSRLREAGIEVVEGVLREQAEQICAPYLKLVRTGRPWVVAKWAMTLDGRIATRSGSSRWISGERSRQLVHHLRGRVDAIIVGRGTARQDDPLLTARPPGTRTATRIVLDRRATLPVDSQLVRTASETPVMVVVGPDAPSAERARLETAGCEVFAVTDGEPGRLIEALLDELGRRRMTNVLVEGGGQVLGTLLDKQMIDEVHVFVAPKLIGGADAPGPIAGLGIERMNDALQIERPEVEIVDGDMYLTGRTTRRTNE